MTNIYKVLFFEVPRNASNVKSSISMHVLYACNLKFSYQMASCYINSYLLLVNVVNINDIYNHDIINHNILSTLTVCNAPLF